MTLPPRARQIMLVLTRIAPVRPLGSYAEINLTLPSGATQMTLRQARIVQVRPLGSLGRMTLPTGEVQVMLVLTRVPQMMEAIIADHQQVVRAGYESSSSSSDSSYAGGYFL